MQVKMLCAGVVGLDAVGPVLLADHAQKRSFEMVAELKVQRQESIDLVYVVEFGSGTGRCKLAAWRETDTETENNPLAERVDPALVVKVTSDYFSMAEREVEGDRVGRSCPLTYRGASSTAQGDGASQGEVVESPVKLRRGQRLQNFVPHQGSATKQH